MVDIKKLAKEIDEDKIRRARAMSIEQKLLLGVRMHAVSCCAIKAGLRIDHPDATEADLHQLLIERLYGS